jgi:hypothetical protein
MQQLGPRGQMAYSIQISPPAANKRKVTNQRQTDEDTHHQGITSHQFLEASVYTFIILKFKKMSTS